MSPVPESTETDEAAAPAPHFAPSAAHARYELDGRAALVTGASRGIGRATAMRLAASGAAVALVSRKQEGLDAVAAEIEQAGGRALPLAAHAGDEAAVRDAVARAVADFGRLDYLVNNAGTSPHFGPLLEAEEVLWEKTFEVNLRGAVRFCRAALPALRASKGRILNVASVAAQIPQPGTGVYCASKAALDMFGRQLAVELAPEGVPVNTLAPGFVRTRFSRAIWDDESRAAELHDQIPAGRIAEPEEIAEAALAILAGMPDFLTGATIVVDGGQRWAAGMTRA